MRWWRRCWICKEVRTTLLAVGGVGVAVTDIQASVRAQRLRAIAGILICAARAGAGRRDGRAARQPTAVAPRIVVVRGRCARRASIRHAQIEGGLRRWRRRCCCAELHLGQIQLVARLVVGVGVGRDVHLPHARGYWRRERGALEPTNAPVPHKGRTWHSHHLRVCVLVPQLNGAKRVVGVARDAPVGVLQAHTHVDRELPGSTAIIRPGEVNGLTSRVTGCAIECIPGIAEIIRRAIADKRR